MDTWLSFQEALLTSHFKTTGADVELDRLFVSRTISTLGDRKGFLQDSGVSVEILRSALVRSCTGDGQEGYNQCLRSSQRDSVWLKSGLCEGDWTTNSSNPKHAAIGKILPQTVATKLKAYN